MDDVLYITDLNFGQDSSETVSQERGGGGQDRLSLRPFEGSFCWA